MDFSYLQKIKKLHIEYLIELKQNASPDFFLPILLKAELTGASIKLNKKEGIVVEERENTIKLYIDGKIKMFVKNLINFSIEVDKVEYTFYGKNLKKNRFIKK